MGKIFEGQVGFAVGTGRCGTKFLSEVLSLESRVSSVHERNPLNETFHRYCKWYRLPVDNEGFLHTKELEVRRDLENHPFSIEVSAQLSLSVRELYARFGAKFILLVRSPERVVTSYLRKGWFDKPIVRGDSQSALGYQEWGHFHHFLGRIVPLGEEFQQWNQMSRVGKLAWYWNVLNACVLEQFEDIPETHWQIQKLEELTYDRYRKITQFLGFQATVTQQIFEQLAQSRPNAMTNVPTVATWSASEIAEFEAKVAPMAQRLGYEYRVDHLPVPHPVIPPSAIQRSVTTLRRLNLRIKRLVGRFREYGILTR